MNDPITWQQIVAGFTILGGLSAIWIRIATVIGKIREDLAEYKLRAATEFARNSDISAVEIRVLGQVANVAVEVRYLRESIDKLLREVATAKGEV